MKGKLFRFVRRRVLDKLFGYDLLDNISIQDKMIVVSGRILSKILHERLKSGHKIAFLKIATAKKIKELGVTAIRFIHYHIFTAYTKKCIPLSKMKHANKLKGGEQNY